MIKHYIQYWRAGVFFADSSDKEIPDREPETLNAELQDTPSDVFAVQFFTVDDNRRKGEVNIVNKTPYIYFGKVIFINDLKEHPEDYGLNNTDVRILTTNLENFKTEKAVHCRTGNWRPLMPGESVINE